MKSFRAILYLLACVILLSGLISCGGGGGGGGSSSADVSDVEGTYSLQGFTIVYQDGSWYNQNSASISSYSGTLKIFSNADVSQTVTINGSSMVGSLKILERTNTQAKVNFSGCVYWVDFAWADPQLTIGIPAACGSTTTETHIWSRTSTSTKASLDSASEVDNSPNEEDLSGVAIGNIPILR